MSPVEAAGAVLWDSGLQLLTAAVELNSAVVLKPIKQKLHYRNLILFEVKEFRLLTAF